ncbi:MAG: NF038130 family PEP-CTERM protein [Chroococcales cyanobacterium]
MVLKKLLFGISVAAGMSAIAIDSAAAANLTNVQFNTTDFKTFNYSTITSSDVNAAKAALEDSDPLTNVELWTSSEFPTANVGFSGNLGSHNVTVESVTSADWQVFGQQWKTDFLAAYPEINAVLNQPVPNFGPLTVNNVLDQLVSTGIPRSGDPNVGAFTLDDATGEFQLDLIGHLDLRPVIQTQGLWTGNTVLDSLVASFPREIQISEVAKVTIDNDVHYAYSFNATPTGIVAADDGFSHSGLYSWKYSPEPTTEKVPEPSAMLGLIAIGGLFAASKRKSQKA